LRWHWGRTEMVMVARETEPATPRQAALPLSRGALLALLSAPVASPAGHKEYSVGVYCYRYTAFGFPYSPATQISEGLTQRYTFQGREASANAGAPMYYRYRMYSAGLGRFGRRDPMLGGDPLYNAYGFPTENAPRHLDPYGEMTDKEFEAIVETRWEYMYVLTLGLGPLSPGVAFRKSVLRDLQQQGYTVERAVSGERISRVRNPQTGDWECRETGPVGCVAGANKPVAPSEPIPSKYDPVGQAETITDWTKFEKELGIEGYSFTISHGRFGSREVKVTATLSTDKCGCDYEITALRQRSSIVLPSRYTRVHNEYWGKYIDTDRQEALLKLEEAHVAHNKAILEAYAAKLTRKRQCSYFDIGSKSAKTLNQEDCDARVEDLQKAIIARLKRDQTAIGIDVYEPALKKELREWPPSRFAPTEYGVADNKAKTAIAALAIKDWSCDDTIPVGKGEKCKKP
jgi:RHS repeat-associated protein